MEIKKNDSEGGNKVSFSLLEKTSFFNYKKPLETFFPFFFSVSQFKPLWEKILYFLSVFFK